MARYPREEQQARARKVTRLVAQARTYSGPHGPLTADDVAALDEDGWVALAGFAHVNVPSDTTRAAVLSVLRAAEAEPDPFAGYPGSGRC